MRSRSSSKPKEMLGRVSAIEGAEEECGGRMELVETEGSNWVPIVKFGSCEGLIGFGG